MTQLPTRVAILATSVKTQQQLSSLLTEAGLNVVAHELPGDGFLAQLENASPDVLLVDLSEESSSETDIIDTLLDYDALPILFNDSSPASGGANALWAKKLARKLTDVICKHETNNSVSLHPAAEMVTADPIIVLSDPSLQRIDSFEPLPEEIKINPAPKPNKVSAPLEKPDGAAVNIWVLGASLGGPQAVRQFLAAIKADLPVAFVLAQHIGANHISLLAEQLDRVTPFKVLSGRSGHLVRHHEVVLAPADKNLNITEDGYVALSPADKGAIYSPSIDNVIEAVAKRYGHMAGAVIFSGMGDDGSRGCNAMAQNGGVVWAQDVASCVISSMPDQARKTNTVTYSANPRALAERLYQYYRD